MEIYLYSTKELLDELKNRHDVCFFAGTKNTKEQAGYVIFDSKGDPMNVKGLVYLSDLKVGTMLASTLYRNYEGED